MNIELRPFVSVFYRPITIVGLLLVGLVVLLAVSAAPPQSTTIRFAVIGSYGSNDVHENEVANLVKSWSPDFIITTGITTCPTARRQQLTRPSGSTTTTSSILTMAHMDQAPCLTASFPLWVATTGTWSREPCSHIWTISPCPATNGITTSCRARYTSSLSIVMFASRMGLPA